MPRVPSSKLVKSFAPAILLAVAACTGPATLIDNQGLHRCYLDGVRETREHIPFRFYGRSRLDVVPTDVDGRPDWDHRAGSIWVALAPPASPWLFPFDFFVEVFVRTIDGPGDLQVEVAVEPVPEAERPAADIRPLGIEELSQRARTARIAR